jgi:hypothetical protein
MSLGCLALAAATAGCGNTPTQPYTVGPITKADLITQGDVICASSNARLITATTVYYTKHHINSLQQPTAAQTTELITLILMPIVEQQVAEIRALGSPPGDEKKVAAFLTATDQEIAVAKKHPAKFASGKVKFAEANKLEKKYGFKVCGKG